MAVCKAPKRSAGRVRGGDGRQRVQEACPHQSPALRQDKLTLIQRLQELLPFAVLEVAQTPLDKESCSTKVMKTWGVTVRSCVESWSASQLLKVLEQRDTM